MIFDVTDLLQNEQYFFGLDGLKDVVNIHVTLLFFILIRLTKINKFNFE